MPQFAVNTGADFNERVRLRGVRHDIVWEPHEFPFIKLIVQATPWAPWAVSELSIMLPLQDWAVVHSNAHIFHGSRMAIRSLKSA